MKPSCCFILALSISSCACNATAQAPTVGNKGKRVKMNALELRAERMNFQLLDISEDGDWSLFRIGAPDNVTRFGVDSSGQPGPVNWPSHGLRVLNMETLEELAQWNADGPVPRAYFLPGERRVLLKRSYRKERFDPSLQSWSFDSSAPEDFCGGDRFLQRASLYRAMRGEVVGYSYRNLEKFDDPILLKASLEDCTVISTHDPGDGEQPDGARINDWTVSSDGSTVAYPFRRKLGGPFSMFVEDIWVRNTSDLSLRARINGLEEWRFSRLALSADGHRLAVDVFRKGLRGNPESEHQVMVFDSSNGELVQQYPIDARMGLAFSHSGKFLAVGQRLVELDNNGYETWAQGRVEVYELSTGILVGWGDFPKVNRPRRNPFAGKINKIMFAPDGKTLIASTDETRVWSVGSGN